MKRWYLLLAPFILILLIWVAFQMLKDAPEPGKTDIPPLNELELDLTPEEQAIYDCIEYGVGCEGK